MADNLRVRVRALAQCYGVQVPVVQFEVSPVKAVLSQFASSVTGCPPVQVRVVEVVSSVPVATTVPDAFLIVSAAVVVVPVASTE